MYVQVVSDLHLDHFHSSHLHWREILYQRVLKGLEYETKPEVLVVAGDHAEIRDPVWLESYRILSEHYPLVVGVLGNHEWYGLTREEVNKQIALLPPNVKILQRECVVYKGYTFAGTTLWFDCGYRKKLEAELPDFEHIPGFRDWVFVENYKDREFVNSLDLRVGLLVTHHLPSYSSVHRRYIGSELNAFFVCCIEDELEVSQPQFAVHGHTHDPCSYRLGVTEVVCNPSGYRRQNNEYSIKIIELL